MCSKILLLLILHELPLSSAHVPLNVCVRNSTAEASNGAPHQNFDDSPLIDVTQIHPRTVDLPSLRQHSTVAAVEMANTTDHTAAILSALNSSNGPVLSAETFPNVEFTALKASLDRLGSREMVTYETIDRDEYTLLPEAQGIVKEGSHEAKVFEAVRQAVDGLKISELPGIVGKEVQSVGQGRGN